MIRAQDRRARIRKMVSCLGIFLPLSASLCLSSPFLFEDRSTLGIGDAFQTADIANVLHYNPARLGLVGEKRVALAFSWHDRNWRPRDDWGWDGNFSEAGLSVAYASPSVGAAVTSWRRGDRRNKIIATNDYGDPIDTLYEFDYETTVLLGTAKRFMDRAWVGITGKYLRYRSNMSDLVERQLGQPLLEKSQTWSADIGVLCQLADYLSLGVVVQNLTDARIDYYVYDALGGEIHLDALPENLVCGLTMRPTARLLVSLDVTHLLTRHVHRFGYYPPVNLGEFTFERDLHLGAEWWIVPYMPLRAGLTSRSLIVESEPLTRKRRNSFFLGSGFHARGMALNVDLILQDRESSIEGAYPNLEVTGSTFRYIVGSLYTF